MNFPGIDVGLTHTIHHTVGIADTFGNHLPDDVQALLSSPGLAGMMISASSTLIDTHLPEDFMSVGKSVSVTHEQPSVIGAAVELTVSVTEFDGYHVTLEMIARDESGLIGTGSHIRSIVNKRWLQIRIHRRLQNL